MKCCSDFQLYSRTNYSWSKGIISQGFPSSLLKCGLTLMQGNLSAFWGFSTGFVLKHKIFLGLFYYFVKDFGVFFQMDHKRPE